MKFFKKSRKGFTLVELIVVIAIVAILAAVSVVSYIAFINKGNESADIQLVKQLNVALEADEALNGPRDTMHEMLGAMEDNGFVVENLTKTKSGYDIVWDQEHNRFGLLNGDSLVYGESTYNSSKAWNIWKFADTEQEVSQETSQEDSEDSNKKYSVYLTEEFAKKGVTELTVNAGLDVGNYDKLTSIKYENTSDNVQKVVIRTNDGKYTTNLEVTAPNDTLSHYGYLKELHVKKIYNESYHEYGKVLGKAVINQGHFVVEAGAEVPQVLVNNVPEGQSAKVTANEKTIISIDDSAASQTTVVANTDEVYVSGDATFNGTHASSIIKATGIKSESTLKQALLDGGFYKVTESFAISNLVNVPAGIKVIVDFAGNTITYNNNWLWTIDGDLTVMDSLADGGISCGKGAFENHGNLTINGGKINSTLRSGSTIVSGYDFNDIYPDAKLVINDVIINTINNYAVYNFAYFELNGGELNSTSSSKYGDGNWGYCISCADNYSNFVANGGTVTGVQGAIALHGGKATINNVVAISNDSDNSHHDSYYALYVAGETGHPTVTINGGTFTAGYRYAMSVGNCSDGGEGNVAIVTANGGTFNGGTGVTDCISVVLTSDNNYGIGSLRINGGNYSTDVSNINGVDTCTYNSSTGYYEVNK